MFYKKAYRSCVITLSDKFTPCKLAQNLKWPTQMRYDNPIVAMKCEYKDGKGFVFSCKTKDGTFFSSSNSQIFDEETLSDRLTFDPTAVCSAQLWYRASNTDKGKQKDEYVKLTGFKLRNGKSDLVMV